MRNGLVVCTVVALVALTGALAQAAPITIPTVTVGNPGNTADGTGYGAVAYEYKIGKYEVTNAEYCEFLNAVAKTDTYGLYAGRMNGGPEGWGGIKRSGDSGSHTYTVREGMGKKPVNYVKWESCVRFVNWLTNGQGTGDTETGSYAINDGTVTVPDHAALAAGKTVKWVLPSENEWYKAAYYDPNKAGGAGYWPYPAKGDNEPEANLNTNTPTEVGKHTKAVSAYGTFDQGGNVWEYNDTQRGDKVGVRGGSFYMHDNEGHMRSSTRYFVLSAKWPNYGFRVAALGNPAAR